MCYISTSSTNDPGRPSCCAYWRDIASRGFAWHYEEEDLTKMPQCVVRVRGRELSWPADRVYRVDAPVLWPPPVQPPPPAVESAAHRVTPFCAAVRIAPRTLFVARRGCCLLSADFAQNELRLSQRLVPHE